MNCIICHGNNIIKKEVFEEVKNGYDIIFVPIKILVCNNCGERYYDRRTMRLIENVEAEMKDKISNLKEVGKVLMYNEAVV